jgi:FMN reductase
VTPPTILGVVASPNPSARTRHAVAAVLAGAEQAGAATSLIWLADSSLSLAIAAISEADAVVFGSPIYRATYTALLKSLLEATERGRYGESSAPLQGKAAATVLTGASHHHFLAVDSLRNVLAGFFAAQVLSPGLYLDHSAFIEDKTLTLETAEIAVAHGVALADLARAVRNSPALRALQPQV